MDAAFACPKCGYELKAQGLIPGRQTRCDWCEAWVEVPFLPRVARPPQRWRAPRRLPAWLVWTWGAVGALAAILVIMITVQWLHAHSHLIQEKQLAGLVATADEDEKAGRLADAVMELEGALELLRTIEPASSSRVTALAARRDALAVREVRAQLEGLSGAPPEQVIGQCLTLLERLDKLPALAVFEESIREHLQRASVQSAAADLAAARDDIEANRWTQALHRCDHLARTIERIDGRPGRQAFEDARALVVRIAEQSGTVIEWTTGQYTFGSLSSYVQALEPALADALHRRGYVTCADGSPWRSAWENAAPFRVAVVVHEELGDVYLQSRNRISLLSARTVLRQKETIVWEGQATARTRVPVPKIPAYPAARLGFGDAPVPEYERVLYNDARTSLLERFGNSLGPLPERVKLVPPTSAEPPSTTTPGPS